MLDPGAPRFGKQPMAGMAGTSGMPLIVSLQELRSELQELDHTVQLLHRDQCRNCTEHGRQIDNVFILLTNCRQDLDISASLICGLQSSGNKQAAALHSLRKQFDEMEVGLPKKLEGDMHKLQSELQNIGRNVEQMAGILFKKVGELEAQQQQHQARTKRRHRVRKLERLLKAEPAQQF
jgi:altronate dehydratase